MHKARCKAVARLFAARGVVCAALIASAQLVSGAEAVSTPRKAEQLKKPELVFRFALQPNPPNKVWEAANLVRGELERLSGGRIQVMFYDSGVLGAERQLLEACYLGVIEMVQCTSSVVTTIDPTFSLLDMPYLFVSEEHHLKVMNGPIGREWLEGLRRHRLQGLAFYSCGFRHMFNSKGRAIRTPADLQGLKIRVMESPVMIQSINAMGASATPMTASELFQALKTGVVDGAENNPNVFISDKFYEADCRNFSFTRHFANQHVLLVNRDWFDRLGKTHPDLQQLIRDVPRDILPEYDRRWEIAVEEAVKEIEARGVKINQIDDVKPFIERVQGVYDEFFKKYPQVPRNLVDRVRKEAGL